MSKSRESRARFYEKLEKRDPENTSIKLALAYVYAMSGELDKSIFHYKSKFINYFEEWCNMIDENNFNQWSKESI